MIIQISLKSKYLFRSQGLGSCMNETVPLKPPAVRESVHIHHAQFTREIEKGGSETG